MENDLRPFSMVPFNSWISQRCELNTVKTRKKDKDLPTLYPPSLRKASKSAVRQAFWEKEFMLKGQH